MQLVICSLKQKDSVRLSVLLYSYYSRLSALTADQPLCMFYCLNMFYQWDSLSGNNMPTFMPFGDLSFSSLFLSFFSQWPCFCDEGLVKPLKEHTQTYQNRNKAQASPHSWNKSIYFFKKVLYSPVAITALLSLRVCLQFHVNMAAVRKVCSSTATVVSKFITIQLYVLKVYNIYQNVGTTEQKFVYTLI